MDTQADLWRMAQAVKSGGLSRREFLRRAAYLTGGVAAASSVLGLAGCAAPSPPTQPSAGGAPKPAAKLTGPINWMIWTTYNHPEVRGEFEKETGVGINSISIANDQDVFVKLKQTGGKGLDVAGANAFWPRKYYDEGLIEALDLDEYSSAKTLIPEFRTHKLWTLPDKKVLGYPLFWAYGGLVYVKDKVSPPPDSWAAFLDPKYKGRMLWYSQDYMLAAMGMLLGAKSPFNLSLDQLEQAKQLYIKAKPNVKAIVSSSSDTVKAFASGEVDIGMVSARGQLLRIKEARGPEMGFVIPKEGTFGFVDVNMLVKGAEHMEAAKRWINFFHSPESMVKVAKQAKYAVTDAKTIDLLEKDPVGKEIVEFNDMRNTAIIEKIYLKLPPDNLDAYIKAWNEVLAS